VADWEATCQWPASVSGNWQGQPKLAGRLRLCSKSVFFEPEDTRVPIARCAAHSAPLPSVSHKHLAGHAAGAQQSMTGDSASVIRIICMMHYTSIGHLSCMPQCHSGQLINLEADHVRRVGRAGCPFGSRAAAGARAQA